MNKKYKIKRRFTESGKYLQSLRGNRGLTQKKVADYLGYSSIQFISNFERGVAGVPADKFKKLAKLYDLHPTESKILVDKIFKGLQQSYLVRVGLE